MMVRTIGGVVLGYLVTALLVSALFYGAFVLIGSERMFESGGYVPKRAWSVASLLLGFLAAVVGGQVSVAIGKGRKAATILASAFLVVGFMTASLSGSRTGPIPSVPRVESVGFREMIQNGKEPAWVSFSNPIIGAAGVLLGATLRKRS